MHFRAISLILLLGLSFLTAGQQAELRFNHLSTADGLSDNQVNCFVQDQMGYIWIGTNDGLNRYDGCTFRIFRTGEDNGICGNNISVLDLDEHGLIWIGTSDGGLCSLDPITMHFESYSIREQIPQATHRVMSMCVGENSLIHIGYEKSGLTSFDTQSMSFSNPFDSTFHFATTEYAMHYSTMDSKLYHSPIFKGLCWTDLKDDIQIVPHTGGEKFPGYTLNHIYEDKNGILWCGGWDTGLHRFDIASKEVDHFTLDGLPIQYTDNEIDAIAEGEKEILWLGTRKNGLYLFDKVESVFEKIEWRIDDEGTTRGEKISSIFKDNTGRMWIGSEAGVSIYDPILNQFEIHRVSALEEEDLYSFFSKSDTLLIGHSNGITYSIQGRIEHYAARTEGKKMSVGVIYEDANGQLLIGTNSSVLRWSLTENRVEPFLRMVNEKYAIYNDIPSSRVSDLLSYSKNGHNHLLAFFFGYDLLVIDPVNDNFTPNHVGKNLSYENLVNRLFVDSEDQLWALGGSKGPLLIHDQMKMDSLRKSDPRLSEKGGFNYHLQARSFLDSGSENYRLDCADITDMVERKDGGFWMSSIGCGLILFDPKNEVETFTSMHSPINSLAGIVTDNKGGLWMSSTKGILHYTISSKTYRLYGPADGIPQKGVNGRMYSDEQGFIYAGGKGFYLRFHPDSIKKNNYTASNFLDEVRIHDRPFPINPSIETLNLVYDENFITFHFSSPNLSAPQLNRYAYKLNGLDKEWQTVSKEVRANYTSIPPGDYSFWSKSKNNDGKWNDAISLLDFSIAPPWWRTWWFYTLLGLSITTLLYSFYRYRIEQEKRLYEVRNEIARDLHDDIGSTLGSISIYSEVAKNSLGNQGEADAVIDIIGETSRNMMDRIGDIVWAVNPKNDPLEQLILRMKNFAAPQLHSQQIDFVFNEANELQKLKLTMIQRKNMFLIYKECIHNILKYSRCDKVIVGLSQNGHQLKMVIKDDGIGFDIKDIKSYNGNGLANMRARAKDLNGEIRISSQRGSGTLIELTFAK